MIQAVFYDLDGTLLDSREDLFAALSRLMLRFGESPLPKGEACALLKQGSRQLVASSLRNRPAGMSDAELYALFNAEYETQMTQQTRPFPGIRDMLSKVRERGIRQAVISNKKRELAERLCRHYFHGSLDLVLGTIPLPRKPDPAMVMHALREWKLRPEEVLYLGDTKSDSGAAKNAGIRMFWAQWGYGDVPEGAESLAHPQQLLEILGREA